MEQPPRGPPLPGLTPAKGLAWIGGAVAWAAAALVGAVLTVVFAATMVVIALMGSVLVALAAAALRARRSLRPQPEPGVLEARNVGGHSWVAYGWDGPR